MSDVNLSVDTEEDFPDSKEILKFMNGDKDYYGFKEIYGFAQLQKKK